MRNHLNEKCRSSEGSLIKAVGLGIYNVLLLFAIGKKRSIGETSGNEMVGFSTNPRIGSSSISEVNCKMCPKDKVPSHM